MTLADSEASGELESNGLISSTEIKLPVLISRTAVTSHREIFGLQKVADPCGGLLSYVKNHSTMGRKKSGVPVPLQSGITSVPKR